MHRRTFWLVVGILIIATFLRTYHLTTAPPGLYPDEAMNGSNALEALRTGDFKIFYPENNGREGLFMNIQALFLQATGLREPWVMRLPSAIFGILTVLGLFFFVRELLRGTRNLESGIWKIPYADRAGLLAAFLLATSFWHINFSRIGFRAITASFFLVWALFFFLRALRRPDSRFQIPDSILAGIFFGLGFYSYISYRVMPLLFLLFIPFFRRTPHFRKAAGMLALATFIVALPLGLYFLGHPADFFGRTTDVSITAGTHPLKDLAVNTVKTVGMLNFQGDGNWRHNAAGRPQLFWPTGIMFWIGAGLGIIVILRQSRRTFFSNKQRVLPPHQVRGQDDSRLRFAALLLFGWIFLAALSVVFSNEGIPHALRSLLMTCPIMALAAIGGIWIYDKALGIAKSMSAAHAVRISAWVLLAVLTFEGYHTYFRIWAANPNVPGAFGADYVALGREVRALPDEQPKYIFLRPSGGHVTMPDPFVSGSFHDVPIFAQTFMFMTDTFSPERQLEHNVRYIVEGEDEAVIPPPGAYRATIQ